MFRRLTKPTSLGGFPLGPLGPFPPPLRLGFTPLSRRRRRLYIAFLPFFFAIIGMFFIGAIAAVFPAFGGIIGFAFFDFAKVKLLAAVIDGVR
jgi:hypothetical protein